MKRSVTNQIVCRWVPGTLDLVRISHPHGQDDVPLHDIRQVLGRQAIQDLYLIGRHTLSLDDRDTRVLLERLGCVSPREVARDTRRTPLGRIVERGGFD